MWEITVFLTVTYCARKNVDANSLVPWPDHTDLSEVGAIMRSFSWYELEHTVFH